MEKVSFLVNHFDEEIHMKFFLANCHFDSCFGYMTLYAW